MSNLVLYEVRYVLLACGYSFDCFTPKILYSSRDSAIFWFLTMIPLAFLCEPQFAFLIFDAKDLYKFVSVLVPCTEIFLTNLKMVICNLKRHKILNLINDVQIVWDEYAASNLEEVRELLAVTRKKARVFVIVYTSAFMFICLEYGLMPLWKWCYYYGFSSQPSNYTISLPYPQRMFYSIESNASFGVTYFFIMVAVYLLGLALAGFDSVFTTLVMHITALFKLLNMEIDQMGMQLRGGAKGHELKSTFKAIILKHKTYLAFIDQLEDAFSLVLMVQFLTSSIVICVVLYQLTLAFGWNEETMKTITYLPGAVLQLYVFCWYAQKITEEAELVANHIYSIPWYLGDPSYEKMCITLMAKAQKPTGVTASKFYMITLQSFQRIISTSYSYFTLLQTMNQQ
ncbi:odorant receptor 13a-like [Anopheles aquasalis]|uniref:odorant receptor 13a-like n=1 Tax=Anopheles aquasalis TaxID=42839 RepID=UPI00215ACD6E|nr:odorant receptor 13a-like [Anopheles aquasalis]